MAEGYWQSLVRHFREHHRARMNAVLSQLFFDLVVGAAVMTVLFLLGKLGTLYGLERKIVAYDIMVDQLFRFGHGLTVVVVLGFAIKHLIDSLR